MGETRPAFGDADLTNCDREQIHTPGSIQPHGALLVMTDPGLTIVHVSENSEAYLGRRPEEVLGRNLESLLGGEGVARVRTGEFAGGDVADLNPVKLELAGPSGSARSFDGVFHRTGGLLALELELAPARSPDHVASFVQQVRFSLRALQQCKDLHELLDLVALRVRELTGFDRVMVYRFDGDWHGEVVSEAHAGGMEPFLGLHFPASDIPKQARALYCNNWLRLIPDVGYTPAKLRAAPGADSRALDLSFSVLRSVSPLHVEYLRNMGVAASMSISLIKDGQLWGLIACHHRAPHRLVYETRAVCEMLGQIVSWQLVSLLEVAQTTRRLEAKQAQARLVASMSRPGTLTDGLLASSETFLGFADATGGAVFHEGALHTVGEVPPAEEITALVEWLAQDPAAEVFATDCVSKHLPRAAASKAVASGLLAIALSRQPSEYVLWFRPEQLRTVTWGGDPNKPVEVAAGEARLSPRRSFKAWKELVQLRSRAWSEADLEAARDLLGAIVAVVLRRAAELKRLNLELATAVAARDDFLSVASHELQTPLATLQLQFQLMLGGRAPIEQEAAARLRAGLELAERQVLRISSLVESLLDATRVRAGKLDLRLVDGVDLATVVNDVLARMVPLAQQRGSPVHRQLGAGAVGRWDPERLDQVVTNLLSNALKFGEGKPVSIELVAEDGTARLIVRDQGIGMTIQEHSRLFRQFERASSHAYGGLGLGLWISQQIVSCLDGVISVVSEPGAGATFSVVLPLSGPAA